MKGRLLKFFHSPIVCFVAIIVLALLVIFYVQTTFRVSPATSEKVAAVVSEDQNISLNNYTCQEFLADAAAAKDGSRLLKSMMMIAWATGYAAAQQSDALRGDARAIQLIAATLGDVCQRNPDQEVITTVAQIIREFATQ